MNRLLVIVAVVLLASCQQNLFPHGQMESIKVSPNGRGFISVPSKKPFHPWGNNYGNNGRLIEDFWATNWPTVTQDFEEMRSMGANVVRVHLQFGKFMRGPDTLNPESLARLGRLLRLAEKTGLYLDLTGLACYRRSDVPAWYDALSESNRWRAQARFWQGIAAECADSPAVFCYDLINEPVVVGDKRKQGEWYTGELGGLNFLQLINLDPAGRPREDIARQWIRSMVHAIHSADKDHLITVGMLPSTPALGFFSGFIPKADAPLFDFISIHIYPEKGKVAEAVDMLRQCDVNKPIVVEETFPLTCSAAELKEFLLASRQYATGWIGHYNGETIPKLERLHQSGKITPGQSLWLEWLQLFTEMGPQMLQANRPAHR